MKLLKTTYYLFVAVFLIIVCLLIASTLPIFNFQVKNVLSGSMEPEIGVGSIVVVRSVDEYQVGDVITFRSPDEPERLITHRIYDLKVTEGVISFITKGDANEEPDTEAVLSRDIVGKVLFDIPLVGYIVGFAQDSKGFMLIIVVPATIIIYDEVRKIGKEIIRLKAQKKKKDEEQDKAIDESGKRDVEQDEENIRLKKEIIILKTEKNMKDKKQDKEIGRLKQEIKGLKKS